VLTIPFSRYRLTFIPIPEAITSYSFTIKLAEINLNMQLSQAAYVSPTVGAETREIVIPTAPNATDPVFLISAAKPRKSGMIENKTNRTMYIKLESKTAGAPLVAADPFTAITAGSSYSFSDYSGDIVGIMSQSFLVGSKVIIRELPLIV
jgi:hypothetical protein